MIELNDVITEYNSGELFTFSDIHFKEGMVTSIIGKNGSGKSTLLKTITGIYPYRGSIKIDGKECKSLGARARARKVSYLPQNLKTANIDVETLVYHGRYPWHKSTRRMSKKDHDVVEYAINVTGLSKYKDRNLKELSGGERQRAYLAMVIAQDTPMILLDEPTTYMDMTVCHTFWEVIRKLVNAGRGIVIVSHNIEQSLSFSDNICLIKDRTVEAMCSPKEIIKNKELLRETFGVTFKKTDDESLLYSYVAVK